MEWSAHFIWYSHSVAWIPKNQCLCLYDCLLVYNHFFSVEEYWNVISNHEFSDEQKFKYSDQSRVNFGVDKLGLTWRDDAIHELDSGNSTVGICKNNLTVTILPANVMCRNCEHSKKDQYYTWHYYSLKTQGAKRKAATKGEAWFLHPEWLNITLEERSLKGREWLKAISDI